MRFLRLTFLAAIFCFLANGAQATTLTVTSNGDSGPGSLRDAIASAGAGDTIMFNLGAGPQSIVLTTAELLINKNLTLLGSGQNLLTVQRSDAGGTPQF